MNQKGNSLIYVLIGILVLVLIVGVYYLAIRLTSLQQPISTNVVNQISPNSNTNLEQAQVGKSSNVKIISPITDPKTQWNTYILSDFGLQFSLPPQAYKDQGDLKEAIGIGQTGTEVCIYFTKAESGSKTAGQCWTNDNDLFLMGADSTDFTAGRSGTFLDTLGFTQNGNKIYKNLNLNRQEDFTAYQPQVINNQNGIKIIKINGRSTRTSTTDPESPDSSIDETLGSGWVGGLINTKTTLYPGIGLQMRLTNNLTDSTFNQILYTFTFTNQNQNPPSIQSLYPMVSEIPFPTGILGNCSSPFSPEDVNILSCWQGILNGAETAVYTGSEASDAQQGLVIVVTIPNYPQQTNGKRILSPHKIGGLEITSAKNNQLTLKTTNGQILIFDLSTDTILN